MNLFRTKTLRIVGTIGAMLASVVAVVLLSGLFVRSQVPVSLHGYHIFVDFWDRGYVSLGGTWVMENDKHAYPLNTSKIICRGQTKECTDSSARIYLGSGTPLLSVIEDVHEISRWDKDVLIYQTSAQCVDYVYTVNRATKQVAGIRKAKSGTDASCDPTPEIKLRLTNGWDTYWQMEKEARPVAINIAALTLILGWGLFRMRKIAKEPVLSKS